MVKIYTSRINNADPDALNITIKSADSAIGHYLAPTKIMVYRHKAGKGDPRFHRYEAMSDEEYTRKYYELLRPRYRANFEVFHEVVRRDRLILCCYCRAGTFCHRHLAVDILQKIANHIGIPVQSGGEI